MTSHTMHYVYTILPALVATAMGIQAGDSITRAQALRSNGAPVVTAPDGNIYCEAEEFQVEGENYYAATLANTFMSRKAFLGAPEQCDETTATINVDVETAGNYMVLVRYEAAYRFETQFRIVIEQGQKTVLDRIYGARENIKIWAFSQKLKAEVKWSWGAVENVVWEGHDAVAELQPGPATIRLIAGPQQAPGARRNVDVMEGIGTLRNTVVAADPDRGN